METSPQQRYDEAKARYAALILELRTANEHLQTLRKSLVEMQNELAALKAALPAKKMGRPRLNPEELAPSTKRMLEAKERALEKKKNQMTDFREAMEVYGCWPDQHARWKSLVASARIILATPPDQKAKVFVVNDYSTYPGGVEGARQFFDLAPRHQIKFCKGEMSRMGRVVAKFPDTILESIPLAKAYGAQLDQVEAYLRELCHVAPMPHEATWAGVEERTLKDFPHFIYNDIATPTASDASDTPYVESSRQRARHPAEFQDMSIRQRSESYQIMAQDNPDLSPVDESGAAINCHPDAF
jgi:hypothetical protein